ncbi:hypothetical protein L6452_03440 [Arctium lappa]|uniref:Uncharacterized protein n=1 Tax=Arctium lappa TaxID=4217 RepID=A0ACB9FMT9_ARCLA|nr:hypothetical protein L6452_03440 [Arctium lappa]
MTLHLVKKRNIFPNMLCGSCKSLHHQRNLKMSMKSVKPMSNLQFQYSDPFDMDPDHIFIDGIPFKSNNISNKNGGRIKKMATNFSHLIHRVTASCLPHHLASAANFADEVSGEEHVYNEEEEEEEEYPEGGYRTKREMEMMMLIGEIFATVSSMKTAYVSLQEAHYPWDADNMRLSDVAVVSELRKLGVLMERFRRSVERAGGGNRRLSEPTMKDAVAPYEVALQRLKTEVKNKEAEVDNLREKLKTATTVNGGGRRKSRSQSHQSKRRVSCSSSQFHSPSVSPAAMATATAELFEICMNSVKDGSKSFASLLLSLMKTADWDITATVRSITASSAGTNAAVPDSIIGPNHAKFSLQSYVNRKIFEGFDHETFYMDGSYSSLLNPNQFRSECFTQYSDMKSMDPMELLGILPTCQFGKFCLKKYLSIVHPKMEESLFGDLEQRRQVLAGNHPRSRFYGELLKVAKAVWLLHLVAFSLDPLPSHFEGSRGADFHPEYMESAARFSGAGAGYVVGFPVSPGFKLGNGYIVKARVYLVPKAEL